MTNPWKTVKKKQIYQNRFGFTLWDDDVITPSGKPGKHMIFEGNDFVMIIAIDQSGKVILINQWRYPIDCQIVELPAGRVEIDATSLETAQKELLEETGATSDNWQELGVFPFLVGAVNIKGHYFLAKNAIIDHKKRPEDTEKSTNMVIDYSQINFHDLSGEAVLGLLLAKQYL